MKHTEGPVNYTVTIEIPCDEYQKYCQNGAVSSLIMKVLEVDKDLNAELVRRQLQSNGNNLSVTYMSSDLKKLRA